MMRTTSNVLKCLAILSALLPCCTSGLASIVYDNSFNDLNRTYGTNGVEFGDEITLDGTDRVVTNFKFEYFLSQNASGNETVQLILHANDGPLITRTLPDSTTVQIPSPGTILYTSPVLSLQSGFQTAEASGFSVNVPDTLTWTVTFQGLESGEVAGLRAYDPPTVGTSFADFWQNNGGSWNTYLLDNPVTAANFAARVTATAVPEPTTMALALLAGLSCMGYLGYKRRS
jgi:hypothetical protein